MNEYHFEYGPCEELDKCSAVQKTMAFESSEYGRVGVTQEATGLAPGTTYRYRLVASNVAGTVLGPEGAFTTLPAAKPSAVTGLPGVVMATSAIVSGTVNPDGQSATYSFEVGVDDGADTQYGVVFLGSAGSGVVPVGEAFTLTGLQPGTTYAYRISVSSGYGTSYGEPVTFTTLGLPSVLESPPLSAMLPVPPIAFPTEASKCKRGFKRGKHGKCVKVKAHKRKTGKRSVRRKK